MQPRTLQKSGFRRGAAAGVCLALAGWTGCLSEQPVFVDAEQSRRVAPAAAQAAEIPSTRAWLHSAHAQLADLLPPDAQPALLTENFLDSVGRPVDVYAHFQLNRTQLHTVLGNFSGLKHTAQGASQVTCVESDPPAWPGFDDVWIEMPDGPRLSARLGMARENHVIRDADCIVILPGFFGDNCVKRTQALAQFLREAGFHVLALEMRGHGQTERTQPDVAYTFGVREADDLMHLADWLQARPHVRRTGLVGFCWSANVALLAAWYENHGEHDPDITPTIAAHLTAGRDRRRYAAGIMAFSPIVQWERLVDDLEKSYTTFSHPVYASLQNTIQERMERKGYPDPDGSLRRLIELEYARCGVTLPGGTAEGYRFLRLAPHGGHVPTVKLNAARMPVAIVQAANDPLAPAQDVVDLFARITNPRVAGIILPGGGHVGFANYAPEYYYSLIAAFFDAGAPQDVALRGPLVTTGN